jgi:hypothetical protein
MLPTKKALAKKARQAADPDHSPKHMAWIRRTFVCAAWKSGECEGPNHAHHVRTAATAGTGLRPSDFDTVPLCAHHHHLLHDVLGPGPFEEKYEVNLMAEAKKLAAASPHKVKA